MYFGLSQEQTLLQDTVARYLEDHASLDAVRTYVAGDKDGDNISSSLAQGLCDLGVTEFVLPEADGGAGLGLLEAVLIQQVLGQHVAPVAYLAQSVLAGLIIRDIENTDLRSQMTSSLASGTKYAMALSEAVSEREAGEVRLENGRLTARLNFVLEAHDADYILLPTGQAGDDPAASQWVCVARAAGECQMLKTIDRTRAFYMMQFEAADCVIFSSRASAANIIAAARILLAADSFGAAEAMLGQAVAYAQQRQQFGRVIGSFQAVKHLCAEMAANLEPIRALLWYAAYAYDTAPEEVPLMSRMVKARMSEVGRDIARGTTEVHGGMGFTDLLGLHFWFKRIGVNRQLLGGPEQVRAEAAREQGWGVQ